MALVVVVPGPGSPDQAARSAGPGVRRTEPVQRVVSALSSSVRAMRGPVPKAGEVSVLDLAEVFSRPTGGQPAFGDGAAEHGAVDQGAEHGSASTNGAGPYPVSAAMTPDSARNQGNKGDPQPADEAAVAEAADLTAELLGAWWTAAARIGRFETPQERPAGGSAEPADLTGALASTVYFQGSAAMVDAEAAALSRYLTDLKLRHEARAETQSAITPDTRVVVGHGVGAVIAYEALCALGDAATVTFVSLGAALCGPDGVFTRLEPAPRNGQGHWPASVRRWFNVVADSDPTAIIAPRLTERFGPGIEDEVVEMKSACGDLPTYLADRTAGRAMAAGLGV